MKLCCRQFSEADALDELERCREVEVTHADLDRVRGADARQLESSPHSARLAEAPLLPVLVHQIEMRVEMQDAYRPFMAVVEALDAGVQQRVVAADDYRHPSVGDARGDRRGARFERRRQVMGHYVGVAADSKQVIGER